MKTVAANTQGQWRSPPDPTRGRDLTAPLHAAIPGHIDGFQRAILLEEHALRDAITAENRELQGRLAPLVAEIYAQLRTPIYPKGGYLALAQALVNAVAGDKRCMYLHAVLASPTALREMDSILQCAATFKRHGFTPLLRLYLTRWENLIESEGENAAMRAFTFRQQVRDVTKLAQQAGFVDVVSPIDVEVDGVTGEILYPTDAHHWWRRVLSASANRGGTCPSLARDVAWCTGFHARQDSLSRLGERQALFDLAIRRTLGQRIAEEHASRPDSEGRAAAMVTLELHKRFLPCYAPTLPVINLDRRATVRGASTSAIA